MYGKRHKKWNQECKQKPSLLFNFCNIFNLLTSRTEKIAWWPDFKPDFYIFSFNEQLRKIYRNFIDKFLLYHTSLIKNEVVINLITLKLKVSRALEVWSLICSSYIVIHNNFYFNPVGVYLLKVKNKNNE